MANDQRALIQAILRSPRIRNRIVILCEGDPLHIDEMQRPPSPQMYASLERTPDSAFYAACIPRDWEGRFIPRFFNCGGRTHVFETFSELLRIHEESPTESFLSPEKLYALVDLDLHADPIPAGYPWESTEEIHGALYDDGLLPEKPDPRHRIFTTALVHKEAFFVLPGTERVWQAQIQPFFRNAPLVLRDLHAEIADCLPTDTYFIDNLPALRSRLTRFSAGGQFDASSAETFRESWYAASRRASVHEYDSLLRALLSVARVKHLWSQIAPDPDKGASLPAQQFREQLELQIGRHISDLDPAMHPLAGFFAWLKPHR